MPPYAAGVKVTPVGASVVMPFAESGAWAERPTKATATCPASRSVAPFTTASFFTCPRPMEMPAVWRGASAEIAASLLRVPMATSACRPPPDETVTSPFPPVPSPPQMAKKATRVSF